MDASSGLGHGRAWFVGRHAVAQLFLWSGLYYLFPALTARILTETGWTAQTLTASFTAGFLVWAIASPFVGRAIDRGYGTQVMQAGAISGAALLVAMSQAGSIAGFAPFMALLGLPMAATLYDPCFALLLRRFGSSGGSSVAKVTLVAGFATLLTFPLVALLVIHMDWRGVMLAAAALLVVAALIIPAQGARRVPDEVPLDAPQDSASSVVFLIGVAFAAIMFSHAALLFTLPVHLRQVPETAQFALILPALLGPAQIAGRLVCVPMIRRVSPVMAVRGVFSLMLLPPLALCILPYRIETILPILLVQGAGYGMLTILRPVLARGFVSQFRLGRDLGLIAMIGLILMALGPAAGGAIWEWTGFRALVGILLAVNLAGLAMLFGIPRRGTTE